MIKEIKTIVTNNGETNGKKWKRYEFEFTDGIKLSTFNEDLGKAFKPGDKVDIETEQKGKFTELKSMVLYSGEMPVKAEKLSSVSSDRERSIVAQTLTKAWARTDKTAEEVLKTYKFFIEKL